MKKLTILFAVMLFAIGAYSQKAVIANYTDTIVNADTHYYMVLSPLTKNYAWTAQVYLDHISGSADSTCVTFEGSIDNTSWYKIDPGTPSLNTLTFQALNKYLKMATTDGNAMYFPTTSVAFPYLRMKVQHYETGTLRVKGWVYLKQL